MKTARQQPNRPATLTLKLLIVAIATLTGCAHLTPVADSDPPAYQDSGQPGLLDCIARSLWPGTSH